MNINLLIASEYSFNQDILDINKRTLSTAKIFYIKNQHPFLRGATKNLVSKIKRIQNQLAVRPGWTWEIS